MIGLSLVAGACILVVLAVQAGVMSRLSPPSTPRHAARSTPERSATALAAAGPPTVVAPADPLSRVVDLLRRHRWTRRTISVASLGAIGFAVWLIGYPFYTNLLQSRIQGRLKKELASGELRQAYECSSRGGEGCQGLQEGDSLTRLTIPKIKVNVVVVEGVGANALRAGAGHYPNTPMPCAVGNVAIAGHRTTYGRPLLNSDLLRPGDVITLETPVGSCTYKVAANPKIVAPTAGWALDPPDDPNAEKLTLTTCHPKGSAKQRLIIEATLVDRQVASS